MRCRRTLVGTLGFGSGALGRVVRFLGVAGWGRGDGWASLGQRPRWGRSGERERWSRLVSDGEREREARWWGSGVAGEEGGEEPEGERGGGVDGGGDCEGWTWGRGGVEEWLLRGGLLRPRSWLELF